MPLIKKLCIKCVNKIEESIGWDMWDEKCWKNGCVCCPNKYKEKENNPRNITGQPPPKCPYYLENIL